MTEDSLSKTGERLIPEDFQTKEEYLLYLKQLFPYKTIKRYLPKKGLILDLGCGEGYGTKIISQYVKKIIGLDIEKETIEHASKKYQSKNCIFELYDGVKIPYKSNTFDAVISFQVIEHIQNDLNYISEVYKVLKKNGIFIVTTPNKIYRIKPGQKVWNRYHIREYSPNELREILKTEFSNIEIWGIQGCEEVQRIELKRVKLFSTISSMDVFNIRKLIPVSFEVYLERLVYKIKAKLICKNKQIKTKEDFLQKYSLENFHIEKKDVEGSLDLLSLAKK